MRIKFLKEILINKKPVDKTNTIEFLHPKNNRKYLDEFISYSSENNFYDFLEYERPTKKQLSNYFKEILIKDVKKKTNIIKQKSWLIKCLNRDVIIGSAKLCDFSLNRRSVQWGYGIGKRFRNSNFLIKTQLSLITYVFDVLKFNRIWGDTYFSNKNVINSQKILKFRDEGIKYQFFFDNKNKKFVDAYSYSFLKEDYLGLLKKNKNRNNFGNSDKFKNDIEILKGINKLICKTLVIRNTHKDNIQMKEVSNWDSLNHFKIISAIEKKYKKKFSSNQLLKLDSSYQILKAIKD